MTINVGLRADHEGQWYDNWRFPGVGSGFLQQQLQRAGQHRVALALDLFQDSGFSGWKSQLFLYDPRVGIAYDVFGTAKRLCAADSEPIAIRFPNGRCGQCHEWSVGRLHLLNGLAVERFLRLQASRVES
jgi:hypothetical protein